MTIEKCIIPNNLSVAYVLPGIRGISVFTKLLNGVDGLKYIEDTVCNFYNLEVSLLHTKRRTREIALARQMTLFLARNTTKLSLKTIGEFYKRDHTTVIHSVQTIRNLIDTDSQIKEEVEYLKSIL